MKEDKPRVTMLVISTGFLVLYFVFSWQWAAAVALVVGVIGITSSYLSARIDWVWMKMAGVLGYIMPKVILSLVFILVLIPISTIFRLFNKDVLMLSNDRESYFLETDREIGKDYFEKTW